MRSCFALLFCLITAIPLASARDSNQHWSEVRSPHFTVLTDAGDKEAVRIAGQFERMRAVFHVLIPSAADSAGSPIVVLALKDKKEMQTLEPEVYLAKGQMNLAGLFMRAPDKNYILMRLDAEGEHPFATIYHEYTHYMLRDASEWIPLWLNEGLAEFYQNSDIENKEVLLGQASIDDILYLRQNRLLPLSTLLKVDAASPYYHEEQKASVFYAESWALTHMIEISDAQKGTHHLEQYADLLMHKQDPVAAAEKTFGDLNQLQRELNQYIAQGRFMMFKMNKAVPIYETASQVISVPSTDANAIRANVMVYNQRTHDAEALIESVLHEDPQNALAHESMGFLKFREGNEAEARKWYGEAVKANSHSYLAHYYYAAISMTMDHEALDPAVESSLRDTIDLNPAFAPAYDALAHYYMRDAAKANEAHMMNVRAIMLEPDNLNYRLNAAAVLLNDHQYGNAISVLKAASHVAKTPEEVATVNSRLSLIEQYQKAVLENQADLARAQSAQPATIVTDTRTATITSGNGRTIVLKPSGPADHPQYPTEDPTGLRHTAHGVVRNVHCSYPMVITLSVEAGAGTPAVKLYRNDFRQIEFSATNFTPQGDLNPCTDIEGLKAKVQYAEVSDKSIAGQIVSIQLSK